MKEMKINYQLNRDQLIQVLTNLFIHSSKFKKLRIFSTIFGGVVAILVYCLFKDIMNKYFSKSIILLIIIMAITLYFFVCKIQLPIHFKGILKQLYSNSEYNYVFSFTTLEITSNSIKCINEYIENTIDMNSIISVYEILNFIIIETNCKTNLFIPVDAILDKEFFINLITNNINVEIKNDYPKKLFYCK